MSVVQNLTGNRTFNMGSATANRGQVSAQGAMGYLQRGIAAITPQTPTRATPFVGSSAWGADGQSDTRSGVAAKSLASQPSNDPSNVFGGHSQQQSQQQGPNVTQGSTPGLFTAPSNPFFAPTSGSTTVQINDAGKLKLPYDFKSASAVLAQKQKADADISSLKQQRQKEALAYLQQANQANSDYGQLRLNTLNEASAKGSAFSSGYGKKVATNATTFNTLAGNLASKEGLSKSIDTSNRSRIATAFKTYLAQAALNQGYTLDSKSGTLNLKKKPKPKPKKKAKK